jgi:hypothetical protein
VIPEELSVEVLNATGQQGFASELAGMLREHSFVISDVGNPPDGVHSTSEVHYPPGAGASGQLLASFFVPTPTLVEDAAIPPGSVQAIVGTDFQQIESPAEKAAEAAEAGESTGEATGDSGSADTGSGEGAASNNPTTATTPPVPTTVELTAPGIEVGNPPPGVKCD